MNWEEAYRKGDIFWDRGAPSPPLKQYFERRPTRGRTLVPGCGHGHEVALAVAQGLDAIGLDIAPTSISEAQALYPALANRFIVGDLFNPAPELRGAFDIILEHTCLSGLSPGMRPAYRKGIDRTLRPGGLLIGVWYINPDLAPDEEGPPFGISVEALTTLFENDYEIVEDYIPDVAFKGRENRERVRVLRRR